jgi:hypothetical protein
MTFDTTGLLRPQGPHAHFLLSAQMAHRMSWDGSATGTGKTFSACAILRHLKKKFIVICPKLAIPQWKEVLEKFGLKAELLINYEKLARGNTPFYKYISQNKYRKLHGLASDVEIPEFLRAYFKFDKDVVVLLDESHKCKGVDSLNAGLLFNLKMQDYQVHLMSATQATTPLDMRAFGFLMGLHDGSMRGFKKFAEDAGAKWVGKWGAQYFDSEDAESMAKLAKVRDFLFNLRKVGARLTRRDFGSIFPKTQVVAEAYDMGAASDKIQAVYDDMEAELARLEEKCESYKDHVLAVITKARRLAELLKVPTMVEMAADFHQEGRSTVLFVNYQDTIDALVMRLSKEFGAHLIGQIHGGVSFKQRQFDLTEFKFDRKLFMVCNLAAGGSCVNMHDILGGRPRSSVINPSYSAISVIQSAGRIDRAYAQSDVYQRFLFAARTIEETSVVPRFDDKNRFVTALNDGTLTDADLIPAHLFKHAHGKNI